MAAAAVLRLLRCCGGRWRRRRRRRLAGKWCVQVGSSGQRALNATDDVRVCVGVGVGGGDSTQPQLVGRMTREQQRVGEGGVRQAGREKSKQAEAVQVQGQSV